MNRALRKEEGFTLVEIIVVIVIMAILAAIAVPSVLGYINDANDAKYLAEARAVYLAIQVEEAKYNASKGNTDPTDTAYIHADKDDVTNGGATIVGYVQDRFPASGDGSCGDIDYATGTYTVSFVSSDGTNVTADVVGNDEITITATA